MPYTIILYRFFPVEAINIKYFRFNKIDIIYSVSTNFFFQK